MKYLRLFKNKEDFSNEIGDKMEIEYPTVSLVSGNDSVFFNADVTREAYLYATEYYGPPMEGSLTLETSEVTPEAAPKSLVLGSEATPGSDLIVLNDYRMFSEIYLNDDTKNLVPELVESSFTINASDLEQVDEYTWHNTNPKKYNCTYVNSFIVSCEEEILDEYIIGFSGFIGYSGGGGGAPALLTSNSSGNHGGLMRDITLIGPLNQIFETPTLREYARINSNTIDLTHFFMMFPLVISPNVVIFKPNENGDLIPLTTTNSYVSNIIEEKTYDISETPILEDFLLMDFTLKCEEDILSGDTLFTYGNNAGPVSIETETIEIAPSDENNTIVPLGTVGDFLAYAKEVGLGVDLIDSKTLGTVNGYFYEDNYFNYIKLCGIMRGENILTQKVNIVGINKYEIGNYSVPTDKFGENKIKFEIPNRFKSPVFWGSYNLIRLNSQALKYNKIIIPGAFQDCYGLTNVTIPNSVTMIGDYAFQYCEGLTSVIIPDSVTSIGQNAFYGCLFTKETFINNSSLDAETNNYWGASIYDIIQEDGLCINGTIAVNCRNNATSVTIPDSVTSIGNYAFYDCSNLASITIPDSVTSIGGSAFGYCSRLTSVNIGSGVTSIGEYAFYNCTGELIVNCNIPSGSSYSNGAFYGADFTSVTIGSGVTTIGDYAFDNCIYLTGITIPNNVTLIGNSVFICCSRLASVTIGSGVTSIGNSAFHSCSRLTSITIPDSVTSIGDYAFYYCNSLTSITIPDSVTSIGNSAFYGCDSLITITCFATTAPSLRGSFMSIGSNGTLRVPTGSDYSTWKSALPSGWVIEYI